MYYMIFEFADEKELMKLYRIYRWDGSPFCPKCESSDIREEKPKVPKNRYSCRDCREKFGDFTDTEFEDENISCPNCDSTNIIDEKLYVLKKNYACRDCGKRFNDFTDTILKDRRFFMCEIAYILENPKNKNYEEIGDDIGWSRQKVSDYIKLVKGSFLEDIFFEDSKIDIDVLKKINKEIHLKTKGILDKYF